MTESENVTMSDNPIEKIRARLDGGNKWMKGDLFDDNEGVCLLGAAQFVETGAHEIGFGSLETVAPLRSVILEQFADRVQNMDLWAPLPHFNDHEDTTWADVELVLDKASLRWEESRASA